jgi:uncharacterized membrane protein
VLGRGVNLGISPATQSGPPGATLEYLVTVTNTGEVEDTFSLSATDELGWGLSISPSELEVPAGESRTATLYVTIPGDAEPGSEDCVRVTARGTWVENLGSCMACVAVIREVSVSISPRYQSGLPGEVVNYAVVVKNTGNVPDNFDLRASDDLSWMITITPRTVSLAPQQSESATLAVIIPYDARGDIEDNIVVTATSQTDNSVSAMDSCVAHVLIVRKVDAVISPNYQSAPPGTSVEYLITIKNLGNVDDSYVLASGDDEGWALELSPMALTVPPGENRTAILRVLIGENALGCTEDNVTVTVTSTSDPTVSTLASCMVHAAVVRGVVVNLSPNYQGGLPGANLIYIVTIWNTGNVPDNYSLRAEDNMGWDLIISPSYLALAPKTSGDALLSVYLPDDALPCTADNIIVIATSLENAEIFASNNCIAHVVGFRTEITELIHPTADIYAYGEFDTGYYRAQLKFDISNIPSGSSILSAKLWLFMWSASGWDGNITLYRVDDQTWDETITANEFDAQILSVRSDFENKFTVRGWDFLDVLNQFKVDHNAGHAYVSFRLMWRYDNGDEPSVGIDDGRFLIISSEQTGMNVIFCSSEYGSRVPYLEVTYVPPYAVSASISPDQKSGLPGAPITYTITVLNTGNLEDTYDLSALDDLGWGLNISPPTITLLPGTMGEALLSVSVPENALPCTKDNVVVIVRSRGDPSISASVNCMAHRLKGEFSLITLYRVGLDADIYLAEGTRLVVKFYTWTGAYQGEVIVWTGMTPAHVVFTENVDHPENLVVENATLVLTDDAGNVISTFTRFVLTRSLLMQRRSAIKSRWPYAPSEERVELMFELSVMKSKWPYAPS